MVGKYNPSSSRTELGPSVPASDHSGDSTERLLDAVVNQTAAILDEQSLAQAVDLPRLCAVAKRHFSDSLVLDPILIELLEAILETHLPQIGQSGASRTKMARAIAQPLFDNPVSRGRLELLWSQLLDKAQ